MGNLRYWYMSRHWHLIYTPSGLADFSALSVSGNPFWTASAELGQGGRHWHIYIETDQNESTIRDKLKLIQKIPAGQKGKRSLHYSLREVQKNNPEYPEENLQLFTLGYTLKNQDMNNLREEDHQHFGYSLLSLREAYDYYQTQTAKKYKPPVVDQEAIDKVMNQPETVQEKWNDYSKFFDDAITLRSVNTNSVIPIDFFRSHSRKYWRAKNGGLLPQSNTTRRFLASIVDRYRVRIKLDDRLALMDKCGY